MVLIEGPTLLGPHLGRVPPVLLLPTRLSPLASGTVLPLAGRAFSFVFACRSLHSDSKVGVPQAQLQPSFLPWLHPLCALGVSSPLRVLNAPIVLISPRKSAAQSSLLLSHRAHSAAYLTLHDEQIPNRTADGPSPTPHPCAFATSGDGHPVLAATRTPLSAGASTETVGCPFRLYPGTDHVPPRPLLPPCPGSCHLSPVLLQ